MVGKYPRSTLYCRYRKEGRKVFQSASIMTQLHCARPVMHLRKEGRLVCSPPTSATAVALQQQPPQQQHQQTPPSAGVVTRRSSGGSNSSSGISRGRRPQRQLQLREQRTAAAAYLFTVLWARGIPGWCGRGGCGWAGGRAGSVSFNVHNL